MSWHQRDSSTSAREPLHQLLVVRTALLCRVCHSHTPLTYSMGGVEGKNKPEMTGDAVRVPPMAGKHPSITSTK